MRSMEGVVTIVQEGRFQLLDDDGVAHHFLLDHSAASEPQQLASLLNKRARVSYTNRGDVIGHVARKILMPDQA